MIQRLAILVLCALLPALAPAQESAEPSQDAIVERVLELQAEIEKLLAALPPEVRDQLRQRLAEAPPATAAQDVAEAPATEPATADAVAETAPVVEPVAVVEPAAAGSPVAEPTTATPPATAPVVAETAGATAVAEAAAEAEPATDTVASTAPVEPPRGEGIPKLIRRRSQRAPCNTLHALDENGDGKISSADRYWRYFYIWTDKNGDRQVQDREVQSAYDQKIREIAVSLETFIRAKGGLGEIRVEDSIVLDLRGDGFSERNRRDDGILAIDADALGRGEGPRLLGAGGKPLAGYVAFRSGLRLEQAGDVTELNCP